ncbi:hypothetical protein FRB99_002596 [Tulasnella sp. 403]|nr:hypothetical protein FRB99_002596 [Tulasnella sp. 403]
MRRIDDPEAAEARQEFLRKVRDYAEHHNYLNSIPSPPWNALVWDNNLVALFTGSFTDEERTQLQRYINTIRGQLRLDEPGDDE